MAEIPKHLTPEAALSRLETVLVPGNKGFCIGVEQAIARLWTSHMLGLSNNPEHKTYCIHPIVHNREVTGAFEQYGVRFVEKFTPEIPRNALLVFSAHGYTKDEMELARALGYKIEDGICVHVTRVHREAIKYAQDGYHILYFGTNGHREAEGVLSEIPDNVTLIDFKHGPKPQEAIETVLRLQKEGKEKFVVLGQTTLSQNDTQIVKDALLSNFPDIKFIDDICYATKNRQDAVVDAIKNHGAQAVIAVGDPTSKNTAMLVSVARDIGIPSQRIETPEQLSLDMLLEKRVIAVTSGASVPGSQLWRVVNWLGQNTNNRARVSLLGAVKNEEDKTFKLPPHLKEVWDRHISQNRIPQTLIA